MRCPCYAVVIGLAVASASLLPGCRKDGDPPKPRRLSGIIDEIDVENAQVTVRYFNEKQNAEATLTGSVTENTEVSINGVLSSLEQLRVGERVDVLGTVQVRDGRREVIASRIQVKRAETIRRKPPAAAPPPTGGTKPEPSAGEQNASAPTTPGENAPPESENP